MSRMMTETEDQQKREAPGAATAGHGPAGGLKPTENEMNFEHVLRRLTIERDEARHKGG